MARCDFTAPCRVYARSDLIPRCVQCIDSRMDMRATFRYRDVISLPRAVCMRPAGVNVRQCYDIYFYRIILAFARMFIRMTHRYGVYARSD